jgi:hypothetical protein
MLSPNCGPRCCAMASRPDGVAASESSGVPGLYEIVPRAPVATGDVFDSVMDSFVDSSKRSALLAANPKGVDLVDNGPRTGDNRRRFRITRGEVKRELLRRLHLLRVLWMPHPG